ncbi:MAG: hypothetical protein AABW65_03260 [Nanoarchaeota archaeon]
MKDIRNNLLKRKEIQFKINSNSNPGFSNSLKIIAEKFKAKEENIVIKAVRNKFGENNFLIDAFIYDSVQDKEKIEPKIKIKKDNMEKK